MITTILFTILATAFWTWMITIYIECLKLGLYRDFKNSDTLGERIMFGTMVFAAPIVFGALIIISIIPSLIALGLIPSL